jgi:sortase A
MELLRRRFPRFVERASWTFGIAGLVVWGAFQVGVARSSQHDLDRFSALTLKQQAPDQSLWSPHRVVAWRKTLSDAFPDPLAVLRITKLQLEVAVLPGTDDRTLDRGVGHIEDTAAPGTSGNTGIAGHRDGFFRGLKDIAAGDTIELDTLDGKSVYQVERTWIVEPEDVSVLDPTPSSALTLVTCYPFYFIGSAPQRFIVRAVRIGGETTPGVKPIQRPMAPRADSRRSVPTLAVVNGSSYAYRADWRVP